MTLTKYIFCLLLMAMSLPPLQATEDICVLNYERRVHPISKIMNEIFTGIPNIVLKNEAIPLDFLDCIKEGFSEIIIIAHSFQIDKQGKKFRLGYYREVSADKREQIIDEFRSGLEDKLAKLEAKWARHKCPERTKSRVAYGRKCRSLFRKKMALRKRIDSIDELDENYLFYDKKIFFNKIFSKSLDFLRSRKQNGQEIFLKNIRLMACTPQELLAAYPPFKALVSEFNLGLDIAPKHNIGSLIKGRYTTAIDKRWLKTSVQFDQEEINDDGFYTYIKLNTLFLYQYGKAKALRGKYRVKVKGLAMGLASKWSSIFIRYSEVAGMEIGEKRKINLPHLDLQLALLMNVEVQLGRKSKVLGTSEVNSLGTSVGFFKSVEIERIY